MASDALCALVAFMAAHVSLYGWGMPPTGSLLQIAIALVTWAGSFHAFGLYGVRRLSALEEFRRLIAATCVATTLLFLLRVSANAPPHRRWLGLTWLLALAFELGVRRFWRWRIRRLREQGVLVARTAVLGTNEEAARLAAVLGEPELGFHFLGFVSTGHDAGPDPAVHGPVIGSVDRLDESVGALGIECLFVASTAVTAGDMVRVAEVARRADIEVRMSANLPDVAVSRLSVQSFGPVLALSVKPARMSRTQAAVKRAFDLALGSVALLLALPVMGVVALAVRLTSPGPALFRQARVTKDGRVFHMLKFRTMRQSGGPERAMDLAKPFFKLADDPRITPVGRVLRKLSLDELPQLWQVVKGDLSLVGPRPLPLLQVRQHEELLRPRHQVRAGITGWWQVNGRSSIDPVQAVRMDLFYIENWSLSLDLFILLKTVGTVLSRRGAC